MLGPVFNNDRIDDNRPREKERKGIYHEEKIMEYDRIHRRHKRPRIEEISTISPEENDDVHSKDAFYVDPKGSKSKSLGPFKEDEDTPFFYPGIHQMDGEVGQNVMEDKNFRYHPEFMAKLATGGWYEKRIIKPKDQNGAEVVEERLGFWPKESSEEKESCSTSSEHNSTHHRHKGYRSKAGFESYAHPNMFGGPQILPGHPPYPCVDGYGAYATNYLSGEIEGLKKQHEEFKKYSEDKTNRLMDHITNTTNSLNQAIDTNSITNATKDLNDLRNEETLSESKKYTDKATKQGI